MITDGGKIKIKLSIMTINFNFYKFLSKSTHFDSNTKHRIIMPEAKTKKETIIQDGLFF